MNEKKTILTRLVEKKPLVKTAQQESNLAAADQEAEKIFNELYDQVFTELGLDKF